MPIRLEKDWQLLCPENISSLEAQLGVYQLADANHQIVFIGYAGARSLFGLRSSLTEDLARWGNGPQYFRVEINMQYISRFEELLMLHVADFGTLPEYNQNLDQTHLGKLTPA
jgi:hypothetical protein